jgi:hypothetical protein
MANEYKNTPVLSKVKLGSETYYMKDADVRALLDTYGDVVTYNVETKLTDGSNIPTGAAVTAAIKSGVSDIAGAMHFIGVKDSVPESYDGAAGDLIIVGTKEYVYDGEKFVELGDEAIYLTTASAETNYVQKVFTIAGIDMKDDITAEEIKTALGLKALAYKDSASATLTDYATDINGVLYTPKGSLSIGLNYTSTAVSSTGSYTPAGSVTGSVTAAGTVTLAKSDDGVAVSGTVSTPTITVTPTTASVQHIDSLGSLPTYTAAEYTAPSVTEATSSFATAGLILRCWCSLLLALPTLLPLLVLTLVLILLPSSMRVLCPLWVLLRLWLLALSPLPLAQSPSLVISLALPSLVLPLLLPQTLRAPLIA